MKITILVFFISLIVKFFALLRDIVLSAYYGVSIESDFYLVLITIISLVLSIVVKSLATSFVPVYSSLLNENNKENSSMYVSILLYVTILINIIIYLLLVFFDSFIFSLFNLPTNKEFKIIYYVSMLSIIFSSIAVILVEKLRVENKHIFVTFIALPLNCFLILSIIIAKEINVIFLGIGVLSGYILQLVMIYLYRKPKLYLKASNKSKKYINKTIKLSVPMFLGASIVELNTLISRIIASKITPGGLSYLSYANNLNMTLYSLILSSIISIFYPKFSKEESKKKKEKLVYYVLSGMFLSLIPITVITINNSNYIVMLLFERGAFTSHDTLLVANILDIYIIGLIFLCIREIFSKMFFANFNTKIPFYNSLFSVFLNILLTIIFTTKFGLSGVALANTISLFVSVIILIYFYEKTIGFLIWKKVINNILKISFCNLISYLIVINTFNFKDENNLYNLFVFATSYLFCYLLLLLLLKEEITKILYSKGKNIYDKKNNIKK